jgi:choline monooxygenase
MDQTYRRPDPNEDRFDRDPEISWTMPARLYFDPGVLEEERRAIFQRSWLYLCHASDLTEPGAYVAAELAGQHVYALRGRDGALRAFFNVCQHRGHLLLKGKGRIGNLVTCPYHAWAYDHEGSLRAAPHCEGVKGFDKADFGIPSVKVEEFCGFVFINLDPRARPMAEVYPGLAEAIGRYRTGIETFRPACDIVFDIAGNWKNVGDNFLECYHCAPAHKAFVDLVDMKTYRVETHDNWSLQDGDCRTCNIAYDFPEGCDRVFSALFIWPAAAILFFPGSPGVFTFTFLPTAPETTHQVLSYYAPGLPLGATEEAALAYFNDVLGPEDVGLVENVQKGLHSLGYHQGRFIIDSSRGHTNEHAVHHFHSLVMQALKLA